jgi:hypothetical protein
MAREASTRASNTGLIEAAWKPESYEGKRARRQPQELALLKWTLIHRQYCTFCNFVILYKM